MPKVNRGREEKTTLELVECMPRALCASRKIRCTRTQAQERMKRVSEALAQMAAGHCAGLDEKSKQALEHVHWPSQVQSWETNVSAQLRFFADLSTSGGQLLCITRCMVRV
jgi:hypothetical protein